MTSPPSAPPSSAPPLSLPRRALKAISAGIACFFRSWIYHAYDTTHRIFITWALVVAFVTLRLETLSLDPPSAVGLFSAVHKASALQESLALGKTRMIYGDKLGKQVVKICSNDLTASDIFSGPGGAALKAYDVTAAKLSRPLGPPPLPSCAVGNISWCTVIPNPALPLVLNSNCSQPLLTPPVPNGWQWGWDVVADVDLARQAAQNPCPYHFTFVRLSVPGWTPCGDTGSGGTSNTSSPATTPTVLSLQYVSPLPFVLLSASFFMTVFCALYFWRASSVLQGRKDVRYAMTTRNYTLCKAFPVCCPRLGLRWFDWGGFEELRSRPPLTGGLLVLKAVDSGLLFAASLAVAFGNPIIGPFSQLWYAVATEAFSFACLMLFGLFFERRFFPVPEEVVKPPNLLEAFCCCCSCHGQSRSRGEQNPLLDGSNHGNDGACDGSRQQYRTSDATNHNVATGGAEAGGGGGGDGSDVVAP